MPEVLNRPRDMTADFFQTKAKKESELGEKKQPDFGMLNYNAKTGVIKQLEGAKVNVNKGNKMELKEKKPQDFGILGYNDMIEAKCEQVPQEQEKSGIDNNKTEVKSKDKIEAECEQLPQEQEQSGIGNNKVMKVLNEAGDMTTDLFKMKAKKES